MSRWFAAAAALALAPASAPAQDVQVPVADVSVSVALEAVDANALDRWPQIGPDLTAAIIAAAAPYLSEDGRTITVVLNEVSLGGTSVLGEGGEFNRLGGWLYVRENPGDPPLLTEEIVLEADTYVLGGTSQFYILPGRPDFYNALVNVFAARVVEELDGID